MRIVSNIGVELLGGIFILICLILALKYNPEYADKNSVPYVSHFETFDFEMAQELHNAKPRPCLVLERIILRRINLGLSHFEIAVVNEYAYIRKGKVFQMKKCFCYPTAKSTSYHIYVKSGRNTVEFVKQHNRFSLPSEWAKSLDAAIDFKIAETLDKMLECEASLPYLRQVKDFNLKPWVLPLYMTYDKVVSHLKYLERELQLLMTVEPTRWKD